MARTMLIDSGLAKNFWTEAVNTAIYLVNRGTIRSLLYLTASRPDIVFNMGLCVRFPSNSKESHLKATKRMLRSLKGMQDLVLYYPSGDSFNLIRIMSYLWGTRKQNSVALSTAETKYIVAASYYAQLLWIKQQLEDFRVNMHDEHRSDRCSA
uniref:Retrovirus-related Pol polyprotein from transposon TNT 1-94 n=1 Tax=Nicotiana tabacum TaxID=4097 RepID=A0A1S4AHF5_TOBAC|nr:PREDICTED: uncharacterized protein LOC107797728 [Nicotiana tabacum]